MTFQEEQLLNYFSQFISDHKKNFIDKVLAQRTRYVTVVLEDIYQSQNASAVVRTCECMGLQDIHIIENLAKYQLNVRVLKGADKWINLARYRNNGVNNTDTCYKALREQGYRIFVADPEEDGLPIDEIDVNEGKIALLFGNELRGASQYARENCDRKVRIPMYGFTESLNISVSVAICLNTLMGKSRKSSADIELTVEEANQLKLQWFKKIVRRSDLLEREFLRTIK
ncbi:RNA methyltransferase [Fulvivirgaceae bacterium PWU20]|uniref:tRNA (guanosine(18)-2'-O)-methyltransferase n=2 Tax=Chryseosolibacter indicus TaxID=2782351 RepID=A0ABS5VQ22_9BACT|nr:RNA methyltransferase [Chryseosolibacter indicus]